MTNIKRITVRFCIVLILSVVLSATFFCASFSADRDTVIDRYLMDILDTFSDDDIIPLMVWVPYADLSGVEAEVERRLGYQISDPGSDDDESVDAFIALKRQINAEINTSNNKKYAEEIAPYCEIDYIAEYANVILCHTTKQMLFKLAECECVEEISYNGYEWKDEGFLVGDVDGDWMLTAADARLALRISAELENKEDYKGIYDMDNDGEITAADARIILRKSARLFDDT
ncbi:MAG: hypothetical protein K6G90_04525 [Clostridia bacterium]|nr:hypothetical protein [Clostridia bacterium]